MFSTRSFISNEDLNLTKKNQLGFFSIIIVRAMIFDKIVGDIIKLKTKFNYDSHFMVVC